MRRPNGFYWLRSVERKDGQRIYHFYQVGDLMVWVFSLLFGFLWMAAMRLLGDHVLTNALATGWISAGNLWMLGGLLWMTKKVRS